VNGFFTTNFFDLGREWAKVAELSSKDSQQVFFVIPVPFFGSEKIEVSTIDQTYKLDLEDVSRYV
jgi:hypothetical protein